MEKLYLEESPKENGWYLGLKEDKKTICFYVMEPKNTTYEICVPFEFKNNPNYKLYLDPTTWNITNDQTLWCKLLQIEKMHILPNVNIDMKIRENHVGKLIQIGNDKYKIVSMHHHIHSWTIYNIENITTKKWSSITCQQNEWYIEDDIKVDILLMDQ